MLPLFPNFKTLDPQDYTDIKSFTEQYPPYNDFEFTSLWTYDTEKLNAISILNDNFVIKIKDFITGKYFYSFLGNKNVKDTIFKLLQRSQDENLGSQLRLVPEINFQERSELEKYFSIIEDPDSNEYILSVSEIASLKGGKYYDKRNLINRFVRFYPNHSIQILNFTDSKTKSEIKKLFLLWEKQKERTKEETEMEFIAIQKLFDIASLISLKGLGVYIDNNLIGFITYHPVQKRYAIVSYEKGDINYDGIYAYLNHQAAKQLEKLDVSYINYEQDLGIPGLKKAKKLWRPVFYLKKYTIELPSTKK